MKLKPIVPLMTLIFAATLTGCNMDGSSDSGSSSSGGSTDSGSTDNGGSSGGGGDEIETDYVEVVNYADITVDPANVVTSAAALNALTNPTAATFSTTEGENTVIGIPVGSTFDNAGPIVISTPVTLVSVDADGNVINPATSAESVTFSGNTCIHITSEGSGSEILNFAFDNDATGTILELTGEKNPDQAIIDAADPSCILSPSDGRSGVIVIEDTTSPVILDSIKVDAININEESGKWRNKASWIYSEGQFELSNASFSNLNTSIQNNAIFTPCNKDGSKELITIQHSAFATFNQGGSETSAIKIGDSSGAAMKESAQECQYSITDNSFSGYLTLISNDANEDVILRPLAIFAEEVGTQSNNELL